MSEALIHELKHPERDSKTGEWYLPGWYFWDETGCARVGPFHSSEFAKMALDAYVDKELG